MIISVNPFNNQEIGRFEETSYAELDRSLLQAQVAFTSWRKTSFEERVGFLRTLSNLLRENTDRYATLISSEMGKVIGDARKEVNKSGIGHEMATVGAREFTNRKSVFYPSLK